MNTRLELLYKSTQAEKNVCRVLDNLGIDYIRQYKIKTPCKTYYIDVFIPYLRLAIEVDGKYYYTDKQKRLDANRSACIRKQGISIYRISNRDAAYPKKVIQLIKRDKKAQKR